MNTGITFNEIHVFLSNVHKSSVLSKLKDWDCRRPEKKYIFYVEKEYDVIKTTFRKISKNINSLLMDGSYLLGLDDIKKYPMSALMTIIKRLPEFIHQCKDSLSKSIEYLMDIEKFEILVMNPGSRNKIIISTIDKFKQSIISLSLVLTGFILGGSEMINILSGVDNKDRFNEIQGQLFTINVTHLVKLVMETNVSVNNCRVPEEEEEKDFIETFRLLKLLINEMKYFTKILASSKSTKHNDDDDWCTLL